MEILNPGAFWLLAAALPVILLSFMRVRRRRKTVATLLFWREALPKRGVFAFGDRLRRPFSLIFRLLFIALVTAAALDLVPTASPPRRTIFILDNSMSMNAVESDGGTRLEKAKKRLLERLPVGERDESAIISCGDEAQILLGFTNQTDTLRQAITSLAPTDQPADFGGAIRLARDLARNEPAAQITLLTDHCAPDAQERTDRAALSDPTTPPHTPKIETIHVGQPLPNAGILRFQPRRDLSDAAKVETLVQMANFSDVPLLGRLIVTLDGEPLDVLPLSIPPGEISTRVLEFVTAAGGQLHAKLEFADSSFADALASDNEAESRLPELSTMRVLCFGPLDEFTRQALAAQEGAALETIEQIPETLAPNELLALTGALPEQLPEGNLLLIHPTSSAPYLKVGEQLASPVVAFQMSDAPLLRFVAIENLTFSGARELIWHGFRSEGSGENKSEENKTQKSDKTTEPFTLAATAAGAPLLVQAESEHRRLLILAAAPNEGDFALRASFPILFANALRWFRSASDEPPPGVSRDRAESDLRAASMSADSRTSEATLNEKTLNEESPNEEPSKSLLTARWPIRCWLFASAILLLLLESVFLLPHQRVGLVLRALTLLVLTLTLFGLEYSRKTGEKMVVFLIDASPSIDENAARQAEEFLRDAIQTAPNAPYQSVRFANGILADDTSGKTSGKTLNATSNKTSDQSTGAHRSATDIASALSSAAGFFRPGYVPSMVLLSDGNATRGDARSVAERLGIPISTVTLPAPKAPAVQLAALELPPTARRGEPFHAEVIVRSNRVTEGTIALYRGDFRVLEETKPLAVGENRFTFSLTAGSTRRENFTATIRSADDTGSKNHSVSKMLLIDGNPRLLLIADEEHSPKELADALRAQEIDVEIRPSAGLPETLDALTPFDAVALCNIPATAFSPRQTENLLRYVHDFGGGLLVLGGDRAFGLGGYEDSPLEEALAVRSRFEREREKPSLALCLTLDRSASMAGEKMAMAKAAAQSAAELLTARDFLAVVTFDHEAQAVVPMQSAGSAAMIRSEISAVDSAGGTSFAPALRVAAEQLDRVSAKFKHLILLTDGYSEPGAFEELAQRIAASGATLSTVGVGAADHALLEELATLGGGRHYRCDDPASIPQIFTRETMLASKSALCEEPFRARQSASFDPLSGIPIESAPQLLGFVRTGVQPKAQTVLTTDDGAPLLAWRRYGLGVSLAFTSDAANRWSAEWLAWPEFSRFWAQTARFAFPPSLAQNAEITWETHDGRTVLTLDALTDYGALNTKGANGAKIAMGARGGFLNATDAQPLDVRLTILRPDGTEEEKTLEQSAPGRFTTTIDTAPFDTATSGAYYLRITVRSNDQTLMEAARVLTVGASEEERVAEPNRDGLRELAEVTGGVFEPKPETVFLDAPNRSARTRTPLWPYGAIAAVLLCVLDLWGTYHPFISKR